MTLALAFKGAEGVVLAADSRVTLQFMSGPPSGPQQIMSAHYDNATKLLKMKSQPHVAAVTYGLAVLGQGQPRTAHSYLPEFEASLQKAGVGRLSVQEFAQRLSDFFMNQHAVSQTPMQAGDMVFLVAGYDENAPYGRTFEIKIPGAPAPTEWHAHDFGLTWGGQGEIAQRIINGLDQPLTQHLTGALNLNAQQVQQLRDTARRVSGVQIPYQLLPLQDCVDLCILLVRTTAQLMQYMIGVRGVGGAIDVAVITSEGTRDVQIKEIQGERERL
jgi:hypothetical protein